MDRFTWAIVVGVLSLVVVGVGAAVVMRGAERAPDLSTPSGVTVAYAIAVQQGDGAAAWDLLSSSAQASGRRDQFVVRVGPGIDTRATVSAEDERIEGDGATVQLARSYAGSRGGPFGLLFGDGASYTNRTTVRLVREAGQWRISVPPDRYLLNTTRD